MNILNSVLPITYNQLIDFANKNNFWQVFDTAFGTQYNRSLAEILRLQWETGDFSQLPQIEVLDSSILGSANGAYASSENRIYLSNTFVASASLAAISGVLLEEIGHFVDAKINQTDSAGDEGAIFAELVQGYSLNTQTLQALKSEDDHATITVNGEVIQVEQQNFTGTAGNDTIIGTTSNDFIYGLAGDDTINTGLGDSDFTDGGAGDDLLIVDYSIGDTGRGMTLSTGVATEGFQGTAYRLNAAGNATLDRVDFSGINRFQVTGTSQNDNINTASGNDTINSGAGDDNIDAGAGDDNIDGVNGASLTPGLGEIDSLTGGTGSDRFILGNATKVYYDDANTLTNGSSDYANINDFNIANGDIIQLQGTSSNYLLAVVGADTQILINKPNTEPDELIGIVRNQTGLSLTGTYFSYVFDNTPPTNQAPTNITLNNSTIAENQPINTKIGNFTTIDPDAGNTFTYTLVSGTGDTDNNVFTITNNELKTKAVFDYETKNSYSIRIKTTDQGGLSFEKQLTIGVTDVNETVANLSISPSNVTQTEGNSGTKAFTFTVTRSEDTSGSSSANWAVTGSGTDQADVTDFGGTFPTSTVVFAAGETTKTIIVDVLGDTTVEPDEGFTVTLSNPTNATITTATAVGTIENDDDVALVLVSQILGSGVTTVKDAKFTGSSQAVDTFTNSSVGIGITSGIVLSSGKVADIYGNNVGNKISTNFSGAGDADLNKLVNGSTKDAAVLEFDFIPTDSFVSFDYVFASEEYKEYVNSQYNDVFGFFVTDTSGITTNIAVIPGTQTPITVNNINDQKNANLYRDNPQSGSESTYNTKFDGFTSVLTATTPVKPGETYKFKLALADTADSALDSAIFIGKGFSSSSLVASNDSFLVTSASQASFDVLKNDFVSSGKPVILDFNSVSDKGGKVSRDNNQTPTDLSDDKLLYTPPLDFNGIDNFQYTLGDGQNGTATGKVSIEVKNTSLAITSTNATQTEGNSGTNAFTFTVTRSGDTTSSSSANWAVTGSGTDQADVTDFGGTFPTSTVVFAAGETTKTIIVDVLGDTTVEPDEGFTVTLSNPTNATITTATAVGTITNDDRTLTPITDYAPNVNISTGLIFSTNGGGNLSLDTNRLSASNEVTGVQNGTKSNFNHLFGLYEVVDAEGGINTEKGVLKPGDSDYARNALTTARVKDFIVQAGSGDTPSTATQLGSGVSLQGNKFYAPFVIANCGTYFPNLQQGVEDFIAAENGDVNRFANALQYVRDLVATEAGNEFNNAPRFVQEPVAYFSFGSANPDKSPHLRSYGNGVYGFEDLPATATQYSNNDFNDAVFALS